MKKISIILSATLLAFSGFRSDDFKPYTEHIPGLSHGLDMVPVPAGEFIMGSPATEKDRKTDEGPQHTVKIDAFWMAKFETSWEMYETFFNKELEVADTKNTPEVQSRVGVVARPTQPYVEMSFGQGKESGFPVCNVTQFAARAFCKWLYAKTGHFYRLPTEAEWEYAARAGSKTAYYFGDDASQLKDYGWFFDNSDGAYKKSGQKKPNAWGLYDMYGNVAEWTSDLYVADFYGKPEAVNNPYVKPTKHYPHVIRGGHWDDDADKLRSAARRTSTPELKQRDPQIPKSDWWLTDAPFLGFRVVRPVKEPSKEEIEAYFARPPKDIP
ncbi:SUMF1/EgtB/PvdO family nonheme iron enzyme [Emticicia sp. TH156]|uniref:formylglycine-generating enzyme family protein n=1 Tax=Emticicia sp. TH156 TaxID=2067454 RepID=UPI001E3B76C9|nr:SUMF1/EgtB/PvdO family nonheme iron enzyme [Emticicia sp. TH156]